MIYAGIDFSLTTPAICVWDDDEKFLFENMDVRYIISTKKYQTICGRVIGIEYPLWAAPMERYKKLADLVIGVVDQFNVDEVFIEGYAYASRTGMAFDRAEATGLVKYKLHNRDIPYTSIAPTAVKKFATSKGGASKTQMFESFLKDTDYDLCQKLECKPHLSPVNDMVDAYYVLKYGVDILR